VVFDRPTSPGNIGTLARSADAFGASALVVTGHAADPYDPQAVRASTGSLFALTVLRVPGPGPVVEHAHAHGYRIVGTDEDGSPLADADLGGRLVVVVGNETHGLSSGWRAACDEVVAISMVGTASSLNAAVAGSIVLHESLRQRG
jgi:tRNA G18 (ribose-2'-O)-methylase SpoU